MTECWSSSHCKMLTGVASHGWGQSITTKHKNLAFTILIHLHICPFARDSESNHFVYLTSRAWTSLNWSLSPECKISAPKDMVKLNLSNSGSWLQDEHHKRQPSTVLIRLQMIIVYVFAPNILEKCNKKKISFTNTLSGI